MRPPPTEIVSVFALILTELLNVVAPFTVVLPSTRSVPLTDVFCRVVSWATFKVPNTDALAITVFVVVVRVGRVRLDKPSSDPAMVTFPLTFALFATDKVDIDNVVADTLFIVI